MAESPDVQELFFTNLQLLGFNVERMEAQVKIPFNKNMFDLPNRRGAEEVLYFLFSRLNPVMCKEEFRNCWPIADKQQEQTFRRGCNNWLSNINKEEPEAMLPRISPSLFLTPGGAKFYQLLYRFSRYVILQVNDKENGMKDKEKHKYPMLTQENKELVESIADTVIGCAIRGRNSFLKTSQEIVSLNRQWKDQSTEMVREYRKLNKEIRDSDLKIRDQIQKSSERSAARGSPIARKRRSKSFEPDFDPKSTQRSQKVNEVRGLWKQFDGFLVSEASEREVIESIVDRSLTKYRIDSAHVSIKVPDLLLRECEKEIRRRHVDNTFHHGKLNLTSLLQLWNLCLHLLHNRFQDSGVPDFTEDIERITSLAHKNHSLLVASQSLQREIEGALPELKRSVDQLRTEVEQAMTNTPTLLRTTAVGLGLMEPTPDVSFSPAPNTHGRQSVDPLVTLTPQEYPTPEAVARISEDISMRVNRVKLFNNSPRISQTERPAVSTKLPRKLAMNQKSSSRGHLDRSKPRVVDVSNSRGHVDRTKPRVVDVRGQLQSTPTKSMRKQPATGHTGLKALNLKLDASFDDNNDGISKDQSTLVQRDRSALGLNVSISKNSSTDSTPRQQDDLFNVINEPSQYCDRTPTSVSDMDINREGVQHRDRKSLSDVLVDEMFGESPTLSPNRVLRSPSNYLMGEVRSSGESPKLSPNRVPRSPSDYLIGEVLSSGESPKLSPNRVTKSASDYLVEKVMSSGVLSSPVMMNRDMSHLIEDKIHSDPGDKKSRLPVQGSLEDIENSMSKLYASGDFSRRDMSATRGVQRPHSPVAEFLDHAEPREKSLVILEKQVDALSDLESSSSSQGLEALDKENAHPVGHSLDLLSDLQRSRSQVSGNQTVELSVEDNKSQEDLDLIPSPGPPVIKDSMHVQESPLLLDIRKIYREAVGEKDGSSHGDQSHTDILDELSSIADAHGNLDSVAMPVFSLNDSDIMDQRESFPASVNSPGNIGVRPPGNIGVRPPVAPGSDNVQELVQNLSHLGSDSNGNPVPHNPRTGVDRRIVNQQVSRDWEELELSMEVLDDLMGKSPDHQKSPSLLSPEFNIFSDHQMSSLLNSPLCPQPTDNSPRGLDLSDDLEESFVPFKEGFSLEGGATPARKVTSHIDTDNGAGQNSTDDLLARFQKLKQKTSQIQNSHQHGPESCA